MSAAPTFVIVPGLRGQVPTHWQTWLAYRLADQHRSVVTVRPLGRDRVDLDERIALLEETVRGIDGPVVLVAHSAGVVATVHWARRHPLSAARVVGALLATPPDLVSPLGPEYPPLERLAELGWSPVPQQPLPFPSIVAASTTDSLGDLDRVRDLAGAWGSEVVVLGPVGHLNPASGFGPWPRGEELVHQVAAHGAGVLS